MRCWVPYILMASLCGATAGNEGPRAPVADLDVARPRNAADQAPPGDRIVLKSGHALDGVRLLRRTPLHLVLEIVPGIEPLLIPRGQVVRVAQGANLVVHTGAETPDSPASSSEPDVLAAVPMSPDFIERISAPLGDGERVFDRQDIVNVIRVVGTMCGVATSIDPEVEDTPMERRLGRWTLPAGVSFEDFLRVHLVRQAPWLETSFESDRVRVSLRSQPESLEARNESTENAGADTPEPSTASAQE